MPGERSMPTGTSGAFILALDPDDLAIGGKGRSLARLARLGLPVPSGFAISGALFETLRLGGPPVPVRLRSAADLDALDVARSTLEGAAFPPAFQDDLAAALDGVANRAGSLDPVTRFAVRSSAATEDRIGALAPGIYASILRVPRDRVADAIRRVLASFLTPAARVYSQQTVISRVPAVEALDNPAVLIHGFVEGDAAGTAALDAAIPRDAASLAPVRIDSHPGQPTAAARDAIEAAVRVASASYGAVEIEWVARGDDVTFLQLRAFAGAPRHAPAALELDPGWIWDAAHNPAPLSPAQAGLVELVDAQCRIGIRQRVSGGYLFFQRGDDRGPPPRPATNPRAALDELRAVIEPRINALGPEPSLSEALAVFLAAYEPLFGSVGPACVTARRALADFLAHALPDGAPLLLGLLARVPSVAADRRAAAHAIAAATGVKERQDAVDVYLRNFGDESPRWDVAEPTLREVPARLLTLYSSHASRPLAGGGAPLIEAAAETGEAHLPRLAAPQQARLEMLLGVARAAVAVGEDDDALFARLQAGVRRALLGVGRRLVEVGRLSDAEDVFYLPLSLVRLVDNRGSASGLKPDAHSSGATQDLTRTAALGRRQVRAASRTPPPSPTIYRPNALVIRGLGGASGRVIGRATHHPLSAPLGVDAVLIAATLLPTELPLLAPAAIVVETGEVLGHVAAQARERGIPAVVGAPGARAAIPEGALVSVDGDRGEVILLVEA